MTTRVAVIGLGLMGSGMAKNLAAAGFRLRVYNRSSQPAKRVAQGTGAVVCATVREAVAEADVAITMLSDGPAVEALMLGADGAVAAAAPGTLFIDASTVTPATSKKLAASARERGCGFLDAPVLGSKDQAAQGALQFLVGGEAADFQRAEPLFAAMGNFAQHLGPTGSGSTLKLVNNAISAAFTAAMAEGALVLKAAGLDEKLATETLMAGSLACRLFGMKWPKIMADDYSTQFQLGLMHKDLRYFLELATEHRSPAPTIALVTQLFQGARNVGFERDDMSSIAAYLGGKRAG